MRTKNQNHSSELREITGFFLFIRNKKTMRITLLVRIFAQEAWDFPFHLANAIKYISRAGRKDKNALVTDLKKAVWYINRYIDYVEKQGVRGKEGKT